MEEGNIIPDKIPPKIWNRKIYDDIILYALNAFGPLPRPIFINGKIDGKEITNRMNKNTFHLHAKRLKKKGQLEDFLAIVDELLKLKPDNLESEAKMPIRIEMERYVLDSLGVTKKDIINFYKELINLINLRALRASSVKKGGKN